MSPSTRRILSSEKENPSCSFFFHDLPGFRGEPAVPTYARFRNVWLRLCRARKRIAIFFGFTSLFVSGCMNFSPMSDPSRFFTLTPMPGAEQSRALDTVKNNSLFLGIGPIRFPAYLDREQIVTRASQNHFEISENDRWAEPLEENFTRVLSQNLGMLLGGARVIRYPWQTSQRPNCQIEMEVLRFEPNTRQDVELLARWTLIDVSNKTALMSRDSRIARRTAAQSMEASVAALSETLGDLSREIADTILAGFRPDDR